MIKISGKMNGLRATSFYTIGNIFNKAVSIITMIIITRMMTTSDYGVATTYLSFVDIGSVIVGLSLGNTLRTAYVDFTDDIHRYMSSIYGLSFISFVGCLIIVPLFIFICEIKVSLCLTVFCIIQSYMTFIINTVLIKYMMKEQVIKRTLLLAVPNSLIAGLSILLIIVLKDNKYYGRILPFVAIYFVIGLTYLISEYSKGKTFYNKKYWKYGLALSSPLIIHGLSINILSSFDRIMITSIKSPSESGIYSLIYSVCLMATVFTNALESSWIPWFTNKMQLGDKKTINKRVVYYINGAMMLTIIIMMVVPEAIKIFADPKYWDGIAMTPPLILATLIIYLYSLCVDAEYYFKNTKKIAINTIIAASSNIILNVIFIPQFGALGASYTTLFAYLISLAIHYFTCKKIDKELFSLSMFVKPIFISAIFIIIFYVTIDYWIIRWLIALGASIYTTKKIYRLKNLKGEN